MTRELLRPLQTVSFQLPKPNSRTRKLWCFSVFIRIQRPRRRRGQVRARDRKELEPRRGESKRRSRAARRVLPSGFRNTQTLDFGDCALPPAVRFEKKGGGRRPPTAEARRAGATDIPHSELYGSNPASFGNSFGSMSAEYFLRLEFGGSEHSALPKIAPTLLR